MPTSDSTPSLLGEVRTNCAEVSQELPFTDIAVVAGAARSGTSWIGQILDSSPDVAYRFQPFFAYAFQGRVTCDSPPGEWASFLRELYFTRDPFVLQYLRRESGEYPTFAKHSRPRFLALKTCRYQYLLRSMLKYFGNQRLIGVVRHPAAVINSWLRTPSEFPVGMDVGSEWRFGACKNQGRESEFFGYYKWKEIAHLYLDLRDQYPERVHLVHYESLVENSLERVEQLFGFLRLPFTESTSEFLRRCHTTHHASPYSVFKDRSVCDRWRTELPRAIAAEIEEDLVGTRLEVFLQ